MTSSVGSSSSHEVSRHHRRERKHRKKHKEERHDHKKKRRRRRREDDRSSSSSDDSDSYRERRKRRKKEHEKKEKKKDRKERRSKNQDSVDTAGLDRNYALATALHSLFSQHPALASDLPIMLVRLGGGTSFDLSQMTNVSAAQGLARVFETLIPLGVQRQDDGSWTWTGPKSDLVLVRVVRAMLNEIGVTTDAIASFETEESSPKTPAVAVEHKDVPDDTNALERQTRSLLKEFEKEKLAKELVGLCQMILDGQVIALDSLPDERLRKGLESLFVTVGLEQTEMEPDDEEDASDDEEPDEETTTTLGYGLPESANAAQRRLMAIQQVCESQSNTVERRNIKGPMPMPQSYDSQAYGQVTEHLEKEDSDDEGPSPVGARVKGPSLPPELIQAQAQRRARELSGVKAGMDASEMMDGDQAREEWMLTPGKFDFLSAIQAGQQRSRTFEGKSGKPQDSAPAVVDPKIQAEMDSIMRAHDESRGLSLLEQHRQEKAKREAASSDKGGWKWSRDKDLDAGRRVDKNALNLVFGGAADNLKQKFQGGFSGGT